METAVQGEDRWLCTLMLKQGWRVEYSAASDSFTACPEVDTANCTMETVYWNCTMELYNGNCTLETVH